MAGMYHGYAGDFQKAALYEEQAKHLSPIDRDESMVDEARARAPFTGLYRSTRYCFTGLARETASVDRAFDPGSNTLEPREPR